MHVAVSVPPRLVDRRGLAALQLEPHDGRTVVEQAHRHRYLTCLLHRASNVAPAGTSRAAAGGEGSVCPPPRMQTTLPKRLRRRRRVVLRRWPTCRSQRSVTCFMERTEGLDEQVTGCMSAEDRPVSACI